MPVYDAAHVPDTVGRGTLDPELAAWLPSGPTLGADVSIAQGRRDHTQLGVGPWPSIGAVDTLVLPGPHGSITVRRHTPSSPGSSPSGALVYIHGGGFTYGTLDEFEVPMRLGCTWSPTGSSRWSATWSRTPTTSGTPTSRP